VLNSGCTNHMTGEKHIFTAFEENNCSSDTIMFGDNSEGKVFMYGKIANITNHSISKVLLVDSREVGQTCSGF
jgi:hypothetical protein